MRKAEIYQIEQRINDLQRRALQLQLLQDLYLVLHMPTCKPAIRVQLQVAKCITD